MTPAEVDFDDDYERDPDRGNECWQCHGEGWGIRGDDWANNDPVNDPDGEVKQCPCCGGTGKAEDCTYW